jgi:hypothetical protein
LESPADPAATALGTALLLATVAPAGELLVLLCKGTDEVLVLFGGSNRGVVSLGGIRVSVERGGGTQARAVTGLALALVTGVTPVPVPVPFVVGFEAARRVASFTSWNFSINWK